MDLFEKLLRVECHNCFIANDYAAYYAAYNDMQPGSSSISNICLSIKCENDIPKNLRYGDGLTMGELIEILQNKSRYISRYAWILRNKDVMNRAYLEGVDEDSDYIWPLHAFTELSKDNAIYNDEEGDRVCPYFEVLLWLNPVYELSLGRVSGWFNQDCDYSFANFDKLTEQFLIKGLVNAYTPGKQQYSISDVHANFDVEAIINSVDET